MIPRCNKTSLTTPWADFSYNGGLDRLEMHLLSEELRSINADNYDVMLVKSVRLRGNDQVSLPVWQCMEAYSSRGECTISPV